MPASPKEPSSQQFCKNCEAVGHLLPFRFAYAAQNGRRRLSFGPSPVMRQLIARYSSGFVYLVSRTGVTGEQAQLSDSVGPLIANTRKFTDLPLAVGFGIANAQDAAAVGSMADAVVVGSAFVRLVENNSESPDLEVKLEALARELKPRELKQGALSARKQ